MTTRLAMLVRMDFEFDCWNCDETNTIWGEHYNGWWTDKYRLPEQWHCWCCNALNTTP